MLGKLDHFFFSLSSAFAAPFDGGSGTVSFYVITALIAAACMLFLSFIQYEFSGRRRNLPPGPKHSLPIFGNLPEMLTNKPAFRWIHRLMDEAGAEIFCVRMFNVNVVTCSSPQLSCEFLRKNDAALASRPETATSRIITKGYLAVALSPDGEQWKKMRRVLTGDTLSPSRLRRLVEKRRKEADYMTGVVLNLCDGGDVNVRTVARTFVGCLIRGMVFGTRSLEENGKVGVREEEYVEALFDAVAHIYAFAVSDFISWLKWFDFEGHVRTTERASKVIDRYQDPIINDRIKKRDEKAGLATAKVSNGEGGGCGGDNNEECDLLDTLVMLKDEKGKPLLSADEINAQVTDLMLAAMDNPSNSIEYIIGELLNQPELYKQAIEELDRVVGKDRLVQESDISKLNFIKAILKESLRRHPVSPFNLPRIALADITVGGYFIPKGSHVLLSRMGIGLNPRTWKDPLKFDPARHFKDGPTSEVVLTDATLEVMTFGIGRRGCVGVGMGTTMMVLSLARLLHGFWWSKSSTCREGEEVNLTEAKDSLLLAKPLMARCSPRLAHNVYVS